MKATDMKFPKRVLVEVRINSSGRATIINPPEDLADVLALAASGVSELGKANQTDFYIAAPSEPDTQRQLAARLAKSLIDHALT